MKVRVYLRIAPTSRGFKVAATSRPSQAPLTAGYDVLPTIAFGLVFDLPREAFDVPIVAEVAVNASELHLLPTEVTVG